MFEFTQRITAWVAGMGSAMEGLQTIQSSQQELGSREKPRVSVSYEINEQECSILLIADVKDTQGITLTPAVVWQSVRGPAPLQFAYNNPNGSQIHESFETPGECDFYIWRYLSNRFAMAWVLGTWTIYNDTSICIFV